MKIDYTKYSDYFECPACSSELDFRDDTIECKGCGRQYEYREGIAALIYEDDNCIPVAYFMEFYNRSDTIQSMNLHLGKNAASRRMYLIEKYIKKFRPGKYLELSAGAGVTTQIALKAGAELVFALDISTELLFNARKMYGEKFIPVIADARFIPFRDKTMDFVLNANLIEHLDLWEKCLTKTLTVTKKNALISTDTYSQDETIDFAPFGEHPAGHLHVYNHYKLKALIEKYAALEKVFLYTFYKYNYKTEKANIKYNTDIYGVGKGKKVFPATPPYIITLAEEKASVKLKKAFRKMYGRLYNSIFLDWIETDEHYKDMLMEKNHKLASMYITASR